MRTKFFKYLFWALAVSALCQAAGLPPALAQAGPGPGAGGPAALTTFETADFSGSGICALCHSRLTDEGDNDVSNDAHWRSTMMANAAKDPLWQAKISAEVQLVDDPALKQLIQEKCSRCHMGMARYQQLTDEGTKDNVYVLGAGFLDPDHYLHEAAMDGVSCTLCHQIKTDNLGQPGSYTGQYAIDTITDPPNRRIFGPYDRVMQGPMQQSAGFLPTLESMDDPHLTDSAHCGSCHTLYTPVLNANGNPVPVPETNPVEYAEFPEQTTYLEWEHSDYNDDIRTCQFCHLPDAVGKVVISNRPPFLTARELFGQHHYVGGNSFMVNLLKLNAADLGVTADGVHLTDTFDRTLAQLEGGETATLTAQATRTGDTLKVEVGVENKAGHKLPSGLPSRRCWLHVVVTDTKNNTIFESGKPLAGGGIEGDDGGDPHPDSPAYEYHYDTITSADQVQIYEPIMLNTDGEVTYTLLRAYSYAKDNRLLPAGFDKDNAGPDIAVHGVAEGDNDFVGGSDQVTYEIRVAGAQGQLNILVELLYQTLSQPFVDDLENTGTDLVNSFMGMYLQTANDPVVLAEVQPPVN